MRKKFRIFSTVATMALVVLIMCVGLWAAKDVTITSGSNDGSLTVEATNDIFATVTVDFKGAFGEEPDNNIQVLEFDANTGTPNETTTSNVTLPDYVFIPESKTKTFDVTVKNDFEDKLTSISAVLTVMTNEGENADMFEITIDEGEASAPATETIAAGASKTFVVTIEYLGNFSAGSTANYSFNLSLTRA